MKSPTPTLRFISKREVTKLTSLCRSTIDRMSARGEFVRKAKIGRRTVYAEAEVLAWMEKRLEEGN